MSAAIERHRQRVREILGESALDAAVKQAIAANKPRTYWDPAHPELTSPPVAPKPAPVASAPAPAPAAAPSTMVFTQKEVDDYEREQAAKKAVASGAPVPKWKPPVQEEAPKGKDAPQAAAGMGPVSISKEVLIGGGVVLAGLVLWKLLSRK